jgi:hypothetical protein
MSASVKAVLFDVDGTLVDTSYLHAVSWWEAFAQAGHEVPMARIHRAIGMGSDQLAGLAPLGRVVFPGGAPSVPGQQRRGRDREVLRSAPPRDERGKRGEPGPVTGVVPDAAGVPAQHRVLVPERQQLSALARFPRAAWTARLSNQRVSKQTILSSAWPASHYRTILAGETAGQPGDRVFGRHRIGY